MEGVGNAWADRVPLDVARLRERVASEIAESGFAYVAGFPGGRTGESVLEFARSLGPLWAAPGASVGTPLIESRPASQASALAPFDRPEAIGWHGDFSTHASRPQLTVAYVARADPRGPPHGSWRAASCDSILAWLNASAKGRDVVASLVSVAIPYGFGTERAPSFFRPLEHRGPAPGRLGLRFYGRTMRDGARLVQGHVPEHLETAIRAVEEAADEVGTVLPAHAGALLITDNWHSVHDRLAQTVDPNLPLRRSLLCFVSRLAVPQPEEPGAVPGHG